MEMDAETIRCFVPGTVVHELDSTEKYEAIHELLAKAPVFRGLENVDHLEKAVVHREMVQSTGLGHGVAVAHGKCTSVGNIVMALGISHKGINFESVDGKPVRFLFLVANPPGMQLEYLLALSVLVRVIRDDRFREELLCCSESFEIEQRLNIAFRRSMLKRGFPFG